MWGSSPACEIELSRVLISLELCGRSKKPMDSHSRHAAITSSGHDKWCRSQLAMPCGLGVQKLNVSLDENFRNLSVRDCNIPNSVNCIRWLCIVRAYLESIKPWKLKIILFGLIHNHIIKRILTSQFWTYTGNQFDLATRQSSVSSD